MSFALSVIFSLLVVFANAQENGNARLNKLQECRIAFQALPKNQQDTYAQHKRKALSEFRKEKYLTSLVAIFDAQQVFDKDVDLTFLEGLCYAQISAIKQAESCYTQVLEISPRHIMALVNLVEINFYAANYIKSIKHIERCNKIINGPINAENAERLPLLHFKYFISILQLSHKEPEKYQKAILKMKQLYTFMDDTPYYYYAKALMLFEKGDKQQAYSWLLKAYRVFNNTQLSDQWNKPLIDVGYLGAHEFMFVRREKK